MRFRIHSSNYGAISILDLEADSVEEAKEKFVNTIDARYRNGEPYAINVDELLTSPTDTCLETVQRTWLANQPWTLGFKDEWPGY